MCQRARDVSVEQGRGQLDRMARHDAAVETVEPARFHVLPGAILDHHVIVDAVALCLAERPVGDLVHADRARRRLVERKGIPRPLPPPVCPRHRVPSPLDLRQRSQQFRCDDRSRMLAEERSVFVPRLGGTLVE